MHPPHPEDVSAPPRNRTSSCSFEDCRAVQHTRRTSSPKYPDLESNQDLDLRRVLCLPLHHRDSCKQSRRLDSHEHEAVYKTAAFLFRATSATSRSAPIGTVSSRF